MGTKKIGTMILEMLLDQPKTLPKIQKSLEAEGVDCSGRELEKSLLRLGVRGYLKIIGSKTDERYILTALGQAVIENTRK